MDRKREELMRREEARLKRLERLDHLIDKDKKRAVKKQIGDRRNAANYETSLERLERLLDAENETSERKRASGDAKEGR